MKAREAPSGAPSAGSVSRLALPSPAAERADEGRWRALALVSLAVLLGMSGWFTATAVAPELQARWQLGASQGAWLTVLVQLGFVAGTAVAAVLNLADILPARRYFPLSALLAALANGALLLVPGFGSALITRFFTGFFLAGVYPPGMKMIATWFRSARGLAIGTVVGALTVGKACPYLLKALGGPSPTPVVLGASLAGMVAALLIAALYRDGPYAFERRTFSWALVGKIVRHRETALATGGYLGHMWELYAGWATLGAFFLHVFAQHGMSGAPLVSAAGLMAFAGIVGGGLGSVVAGAWADRWGRENVASWAMAVSGTCALVLGWLTNGPLWIVVTVALAWGFAIVADSAQFSALVTEVAPKHAVGTALTIQTSLGFSLAAVSIWLTVEIADRFGWGPAFSLLAIGPALGVIAMLRLKVTRSRSALPPLRTTGAPALPPTPPATRPSSPGS